MAWPGAALIGQGWWRFADQGCDGVAHQRIVFGLPCSLSTRRFSLRACAGP